MLTARGLLNYCCYIKQWIVVDTESNPFRTSPVLSEFQTSLIQTIKINLEKHRHPDTVYRRLNLNIALQNDIQHVGLDALSADLKKALLSSSIFKQPLFEESLACLRLFFEETVVHGEVLYGLTGEGRKLYFREHCNSEALNQGFMRFIGECIRLECYLHARILHEYLSIGRCLLKRIAENQYESVTTLLYSGLTTLLSLTVEDSADVKHIYAAQSFMYSLLHMEIFDQPFATTLYPEGYMKPMEENKKLLRRLDTPEELILTIPSEYQRDESDSPPLPVKNGVKVEKPAEHPVAENATHAGIREKVAFWRHKKREASVQNTDLERLLKK